MNPDYFDKNIPRTSLQLIAIKVNQDILNKGFNAGDYLKAEQYMDILRYYEYSKAIDGGVLITLLDIK